MVSERIDVVGHHTAGVADDLGVTLFQPEQTVDFTRRRASMPATTATGRRGGICRSPLSIFLEKKSPVYTGDIERMEHHERRCRGAESRDDGALPKQGW